MTREFINAWNARSAQRLNPELTPEWREGNEARWNNKSIYDNPYEFGSEEYHRWQYGWKFHKEM